MKMGISVKNSTLVKEKQGKRDRFILTNLSWQRCVFSGIIFRHRKKKYNDYLFTSESNHRTHKDGTIKPITHSAAESIIKNTLHSMGVSLKNDPRCSSGEIKLNTHSLRKMYGGVFCRTGHRLKEEGRLNVDLEVIQLLQNDYMHTSMATTQRYCGEMERAKQIIVNNMNIGLPILRVYL